jgi:hypothetical protein
MAEPCLDCPSVVALVGEGVSTGVAEHVREGFPGKLIDRIRHHRPSRARIIAGLSGFLTLIQSRDGPERYGAFSRFDTMPSKPNLQACRNTKAPSTSVCSLKTIPAGFRPNSFASFALRAPWRRPGAQ